MSPLAPTGQISAPTEERQGSGELRGSFLGSVGMVANVRCFLQTRTTAEVGRVGLPSALQIFLSPPSHGSWQKGSSSRESVAKGGSPVAS